MCVEGKLKPAIALIFVFALYVLAGSIEYVEEKRAHQRYCEGVSKKLHPDYKKQC